jgi:type I restriction enzyme S subunit
MNSPWPIVKLGEMLMPVSRPEIVDPSKTYRILGAHWYAGGLYTKDVKLGSGVQAKWLYRVEEDDFVYNRLFAWKGSFALATADNTGCYVSNEFPCFVMKSDRVDGRYLWRYFSRASAWDDALGLSTGGTPTSRNRLKEEKFLAMQIPLPPLAEQRRIVARIEELSAKIEEARTLRQEAADDIEALCRSVLSHDKGARPTPMRELVRLRSPDVTVTADATYEFAGVYCFGRGVFRAGRKSGMDFAYPRLTTLRAGNFVYPKLMAWEGALGIVPPECDGCVVSTEFPVFQVLEDRVLPEVLDTYFRNSSVWPEMSSASTGTNVRRRRLHPQEFLDYRMPLPSWETQLTLRMVRLEVDKLKPAQIKTAAELDALLPSILDRAFKGEL